MFIELKNTQGRTFAINTDCIVRFDPALVSSDPLEVPKESKTETRIVYTAAGVKMDVIVPYPFEVTLLMLQGLRKM